MGRIVKALKIRDKERIETSEIPNGFIQKCKSISQNGGLSPLQSIRTMSEGLCNAMYSVKLSSPPRSVLPKNQTRSTVAMMRRNRHSMMLWRLFGVCKRFMALLFLFAFFNYLGDGGLYVNQAFTSINEEVFGWLAAAFNSDGVNGLDG